ncbi:MAG TPA: hypothetical protein PKC24_01965 [Cyclobacteriaceae bacterium]|mgnify:CR=1 FL=1|nr:hypothetical protein [Cyclobacteriaceae bacterium]
MGRHEIRLRRSQMTSRMMERYKNYPEVMRRYEREQQFKKLIKGITLILFMLSLFLMVYLIVKMEKKQVEQKENQKIELSHSIYGNQKTPASRTARQKSDAIEFGAMYQSPARYHRV